MGNRALPVLASCASDDRHLLVGGNASPSARCQVATVSTSKERQFGGRSPPHQHGTWVVAAVALEIFTVGGTESH